MADAGTYAAQASAIYDPQLQAEQGALSTKLAGDNASLDTASRSTQSAYTEALANAGKTRDANAARQDFVASTHGLWSSGLAGNAQRLVGANYADNANNIELARANKLSDIAGRKALAQQGYDQGLSSLTSRYAGLKSKYAIDHQNADAAEAAKEAAANQRQAASDARYAARHSASVDPAKGYGMIRNADAAGGLAFHGNHGEPISIGAYYSALGGSTADIANTLGSSDSAGDKKISQDITQNHLTVDQISKKYPWLMQ